MFSVLVIITASVVNTVVPDEVISRTVLDQVLIAFHQSYVATDRTSTGTAGYIFFSSEKASGELAIHVHIVC